MAGTVLSADQVCSAVEGSLRAGYKVTLDLPPVLALLGDVRGRYRDITEWQQLPTIEALSTAKTPAVAITSPGLASAPTYQRSRNSWEVTWRVAIGVYERGADHQETQAKVRNWIAVLRITLQRDPTLGGVAKTLTWTGEEYNLLPARQAARSLALGALAVDVITDVPDLDFIGLPPVTSTHPVVTARTPADTPQE